MNFYIVYYSGSYHPVGWFSTKEKAEEAISLCYERMLVFNSGSIGHFYWVECSLDTIYGRFARNHLNMFTKSEFVDNVDYKELAIKNA